ncbi:Lysine-specific demethylase 8 [Borealophlyctis nickersoniae]|nr:Lysine-specific demethylase 8 [Borealophlyctis nickersoniae]
MEEALKVLDMTLLVSGCPYYKAMVVEVVEVLEASLGESSNPPSLLDPVSITPDNPPQITFPVPRASPPPTIIQFSHHLTSNPTPLLIPNAISHWPALTTRPWSDIRYLRSLAGARRLVPVEVGSKYTDDEWTQKLMTFGEFIDRYVTGSEEGTAYLAQHDLFTQIPRLAHDITIPDYCYCSPSDDDDDDNDAEVVTNAWFGPRGTISPLHTDPRQNVFAQVVGYKYVRLYAPDETRNVYPCEGVLGNTSQVDVESPDMTQFPLFASAKYVECIVGPGDLLFIPKGWWHYVRSLSVSFSVSFWFG